jgi:sugar/nucleoside kinase (ribokinase family)
MTPRMWVLGNLTVDDVVMADGTTTFGLCGGNALFAARGAHVWEDAVGVAARIGPDFPSQQRDKLHGLGLELALVEVPMRTIHNWALYESNDIRKFVLWNGSGTHLEQSLRVEELPSLTGAEACHIAPMPLSIQVELVQAARRSVRVVSLDPHEEHIAGNEDVLLDLLPSVTLFLPSRSEAELLFGRDDPEAAAVAFVEAGATIAAVKLAEEGSVVTIGGSRTVHVPAVEVNAIDPTGAGDGYCGGFTAAYTQGHDAFAAACHGTVSASLICEARGALSHASRDRSLASGRLARLIERVGLPSST